MNNTSPVTPETKEGALPLAKKAWWASGAITDVFMSNAFSYLALPIYNVGLKVDPVFLGWAMGVPRIWDAVADVFIGDRSDRFRSKWGRRRPFIFIGALLSGLFFALMWMPPTSASTKMIGWYFFGMAILYYTAYAIFTVPWGALGLELSSDTNERTKVQAMKNVFQSLGGIFLGGIWWLTLNIGENEIEGARWAGVIFGLVIAAAGILPAIFSREKVVTGNNSTFSFWKSVKATFSNSKFLCLVGLTMSVIFGVFVINSFALYINLLYVFDGDKNAVAGLNLVVGAAFQVFGLLISPWIAQLSQRFGKKRTLIGGLLMVMIGFGSSWWTYTPLHPYLQCVTLLLMSPGLSTLWIIAPSILADICDIDEQKTGLRREGMYSAAYAWTIKATIASTMVVSGYMLNWAGYDAAKAVQSPEVITALRHLYWIIPVSMTLVGIYCASLLPSLKNEK